MTKSSSKVKSHQVYMVPKDAEGPHAGKRVPGVTTINKNLGWSADALFRWGVNEAVAGRNPLAVRDQAADIGTICHKLIEVHILEVMGKGESFDPLAEHGRDDVEKAENAMIAFLDWEQVNQPEYLHTEMMFASPRGYGGTIDLVAKIEGEMTLVDFKTSKGIYAEHFIQVSAYDKGLREILNIHCDRCKILRIGKEHGEFEVHEISQVQKSNGWKMFELLLQIHPMKKLFK